MRYVCLVYGPESALASLSRERLSKLDRDTLDYDRKLQISGKLVIAQALRSVQSAKSVRRRKGKIMVTDGPFAETKEQLLGFIMIEAGNLEDALRIAGESPLAEIGTVEVRPVYEVAEREASAASA